MYNRSLKILTATTVATSIVAPIASANTEFKDISPTNSHYDAVQLLVERGVINGYEDGTFRPNVSLTRGQAAKILANVLNLDTSSTDQKFKDVTTKSGYIGAINALANAGIMNGYEDQSFKPNAPLTRGQMAKILVNAFKLEKSAELVHSFIDVSDANGYKYDIQTLVDYGITQGTTSTTYAPTEAVKRGQMATFVVRAEKAVKEKTAVFNVTAVKGSTLVTEQGEYSIPAQFAFLLNEKNNATLIGAELEVTLKDNKIAQLNSVVINAGGTADAPIKLTGEAETLNGSLIIKADHIVIEKLIIAQNLLLSSENQQLVTMQEVTVNGETVIEEQIAKTASITPIVANNTQAKYQFINSKIAHLIVQKDNVEVTIDDKTSVETATIAGAVKTATFNGSFKSVVLKQVSPLTLNGSAKIALLKADVVNKLTLGLLVKLELVDLLAGMTAEGFFANFSSLKNNIGKITTGGTPVTENTVTDGGSSTSWDVSNPAQPIPKPQPEKEPDQEINQPQPENSYTPPTIGETKLEVLPATPDGAVVSLNVTAITTTADTALTTNDTASTSADTVKVWSDTNSLTVLDVEVEQFIIRNRAALVGANIRFIVNTAGEIIGISDIELADNALELDGSLGDNKRITIYGNITVAKETTELKNIIVAGSVYVPNTKTTSLDISNTKIYRDFKFIETAAPIVASRMLVASLSPIAAATTKIRITFHDSSVAIIEISKKDVELYAKGQTTEIAEINVRSNTTIDAPDVVFPKIILSPGATNVHINASIKDVVIESDEEIVVTGKGNFETVAVNSAANVALNVEGNIKSLVADNDKAKVDLGEKVSLDVIATKKPVEEVIKDYAKVQAQIGKTETLNYYFALELNGVPNKLGYFKFKIVGQGKYKVMYDLLPYNMQIEDVVDKQISNTAKLYTLDSEVFIPGERKIVVYLVDNNNNVVSYDNYYSIGDIYKFTSTESGVLLETNLIVEDGASVADTYTTLINIGVDEKAVILGEEELKQYKWSVKDGIASVELPAYTSTIDFGENHTYFNLSAIKRKTFSGSTSTSGGGNNAEERAAYRTTALAAIKEIYANADELDKGMLTNTLNIVFYHGMIDRENRVVYLNDPSEYVTAVKQATTLENLYDRIVEINSLKIK